MAVSSICDIDLDTVTLPDTYRTEDTTLQTEHSPPPQKPKSLLQKWDWNANFIPLKWDGNTHPTITHNTTHIHAPNCNSHSHSPTQVTPTQTQQSPLKNKTQSYRDDTAIPPWIRTTYTHHNFIDKLHMELVDFCMYVSPTKSEHSIRLSLIQRITKIVKSLWPNSEIHVFGSMKTKLYLPTSDIDLVIYTNDTHTHHSDCKLRLAQAFKQSQMCSYLEIISKARVPLIKFTDAVSNINVDIVFERESGIVAADEINALQSKYPALRPLTYFLKYFLWFRGLNEPFRGGMGSYLLQMLIVNLIQTHPIRATPKWRSVDSEVSLGGWLMAFFELYGKHFNYSQIGIAAYPKAHYFNKQSKGMKMYDRPYLLCCKCPFESTKSKIMDSGRNTYNIMKIRSAFEWAYNTLLANASNKKSRKSILGLLVGIRGQMLEIRSKDNQCKLVRFKSLSPSPIGSDQEMSGLISRTFESENDSESEECSSKSDSNCALFIPLTVNEASVSVSDSECTSSSSMSTLSSSSSSSYDSYNGDRNEKGELAYYEASEFQQKHLFLTHKSPKIKSKSRERMGRVTFSFEDIDLDRDHNPYLNNKYKSKKRKRAEVREDNICWNYAAGHCFRGDKCRWVHSEIKTPKVKKLKTMSNVNLDKSATVMEGMKGTKDMNGKGGNVKLSRSYSMPDLRKSTPCIFYQKNSCHKGEACPFQHSLKGDLLIDNLKT